MSSGSAPATGSRPPRRKRFRARPIGYHPAMGIRFVSLFVVASLFAIGASCASDDDGQRSVQHHRTCGVGRARPRSRRTTRRTCEITGAIVVQTAQAPDGLPGRRERRPRLRGRTTRACHAGRCVSDDLEKVRGDTVQRDRLSSRRTATRARRSPTAVVRRGARSSDRAGDDTADSTVTAAVPAARRAARAARRSAPGATSSPNDPDDEGSHRRHRGDREPRLRTDPDDHGVMDDHDNSGKG